MTPLDLDVCNAATYTDDMQEDVLTTELALRLLRNRPVDKPFFLQIAYLSPHTPTFATQEMLESVSSRTWPLPFNNSEGVPFPAHCLQSNGPDGNQTRCNYAALMEKVDSQIQRVLDELDMQGVLDETVIIFSSDHGEMLGDHGMEGKTRHYQSSTSVPLMISGPGVAKGLEIHRPVTTMDIAGTVLDLAGVEAHQAMTTKSLRELWEFKTSCRDLVYSGHSYWRMVVKEINGVTYKYARCTMECWREGMASCRRSAHHQCIDSVGSSFDRCSRGPL